MTIAVAFFVVGISTLYAAFAKPLRDIFIGGSDEDEAISRWFSNLSLQELIHLELKLRTALACLLLSGLLLAMKDFPK
jgi:hypothetical protein